MSKVYALRNDGVRFQEIDLMIDDIIDERPVDVDEDAVLDFSITNHSMASWWPTPATEFVGIDGDDNAPIPDIAKWIDATLVLSPKAHRLLGETLAEFGEFLPITIGGEVYQIFNCLTFAKIDESKSKKSYYDGVESGVSAIVFDSKDVESKLIFKTDYNSCVELYSNDRLKDLCQGFGLRGVQFSEELVLFS